MKSKVIRSINELGALEPGWNNLLENFAYHDVGYSYKWFQHWTNSFLENKPMRVVAIEEDEQLISVLPLYEEKMSYFKMNIPVLQSMTNWHSHRFDLLAKNDNEEIFCKAINAAFAEGREHLIVLNFVPGDSYVLKQLSSACKEMKWNYAISEHSTNSQIKEANTFTEYFEQLDGKFRRNVRAAEKKALNKGALSLMQLKDENEIDHFLERGFAIEASGWKGCQGTAIACNQSVRRFYEGIAKDLFKRGEFDAYLLGSGDDDLAFLYCIKGFGVVRALKIGANENFRNLAPGMLITKEVLNRLHDDGNFKTWDFCGGQARWKTDWGNDTEKLYNVAIYNNSLMGKALYKFGACTKYVV